jgi:hypothetical protein
VVLFQINSGVGALPPDPLRIVNPVDLVTLALAGVTFLGFWPTFRNVNRALIGIAVALPPVGAAVLLATSLAGRSSVMAAGLVIAFLMLRCQADRSLAYLGLLANALLLVGDFGTGESPSPVVTALVAVGYVLLAVWFLPIGARTRGSVRSRLTALP